MASITLSKAQFFALVALNIIALIGIFSAFFSGIEDRAIIKVRLNDVLSNISQGERLQTVTINEIKDFEQISENRSQRLLPPFERFINGTDELRGNVQNLTTALGMGIERQEDVIQKLDEIKGLLNSSL